MVQTDTPAMEAGRVMRLAIENRRTCDSCHGRGDVYLVAIGGYIAFRLCDRCFSQMRQAYVKLSTEQLDSIEVK
jgi:tartrate dehydratase beta subunit/fumarate hydratase class I family protein